MSEANKQPAGFNLLGLPFDCILQVLSFVPLPVCIYLRSTCSKLKAAVDEHFRTGVRTLPVLLSAHYSPESVRLYDGLYAEKFENLSYRQSQPEFNKYLHSYKKMTFGSGVSKWEMWENKKIFQNQKAQFHRENYSILFDMTKFGQFVEFISKYLPTVTKLSLLLDHDDHLENIPTVVNLYRKQLKVLLLERTNRSAGTISYNSDESRFNRSRYARNVHNFQLSEETYQSIDSLEALEKLYFFPKGARDDRAIVGDSVGRLFVERMLQKLRILHLPVHYTSDYNNVTIFSFQSDVYEKLEELCFGTPDVFSNENPDYPQFSNQEFLPKNVSFPRLKKCFFLRSENMELLSPKQMPNLKEIGVYELETEYESMKALNSFPNLVQTHSISEHVYRQKFEVSRWGPDETFVADRDPRFPLQEDESGRLFVNIGERLKHFPGPDIICRGLRNPRNASKLE